MLVYLLLLICLMAGHSQAELGCGFQLPEWMTKPRSTGGFRTGFVQSDPAWTNGVVPVQYDYTLSMADRAAMHKAMYLIESVTCVRFKERDEEQNYVTLSNERCTGKPEEFKGGKATLGMIPKSHLSVNCLSLEDPGPGVLSTLVHEFLHVLGMIHTQSRPDRDQYVTLTPFLKDGADNGDYAKCLQCNTYNITYDCHSIMHYSAGSNSLIKGEKTMVHATGSNQCTDDRFGGTRMTNLDVQIVNRTYSCKNNIASDVGPQPWHRYAQCQGFIPQPAEPEDRQCCSKNRPCSLGHGDCGDDDDCGKGLHCGPPGSCIKYARDASLKTSCCIPGKCITVNGYEIFPLDPIQWLDDIPSAGACKKAIQAWWKEATVWSYNATDQKCLASSCAGGECLIPSAKPGLKGGFVNCAPGETGIPKPIDTGKCPTIKGYIVYGSYFSNSVPDAMSCKIKVMLLEKTATVWAYSSRSQRCFFSECRDGECMVASDEPGSVAGFTSSCPPGGVPKPKTTRSPISRWRQPRSPVSGPRAGSAF